MIGIGDADTQNWVSTRRECGLDTCDCSTTTGVWASKGMLMVHEREGGQGRSKIIGDPRSLSPEVDGPGRQRRRPMLIELNVLFPGGLGAVRDEFYTLWRGMAAAFDLPYKDEPAHETTTQPPVPAGLEMIAPKLYQCVLTGSEIHDLVAADEQRETDGRPSTIFRVWPDYQLEQQIDRSAPTVKADAAWRSYDARGAGIVWAVIDSGIQATHGHFTGLEIGAEPGRTVPGARTGGLHRDFSHLVVFDDEAESERPTAKNASPLTDESGHGTHVAAIVSGSSAAAPSSGRAGHGVEQSVEQISVASSELPEAGPPGFVSRSRVGVLSGMAPLCELVSIKVVRRSPQGLWVTSAAAVIRALTYLRDEVNTDPGLLRVHGVNISLGCDWRPQDYAAGQSPLCQAITQIVATGVVVVVSAGNSGSRDSDADLASPSAVLGSITEPAHTEDCVAVGSTHRDAPHAFGITWTSSKGPTLDGRMKPDLVAPGEWITSAAVGRLATEKGLAAEGTLSYAEQSGTSMAAPHVSGVVAAFLSARPEFIGRPRQVKALLTGSATDLGRERYAQGSGLVDLMRMLANV